MLRRTALVLAVWILHTLSSLAWALEPDRNAIIAAQLDCVGARMEEGAVDWTDICQVPDADSVEDNVVLPPSEPAARAITIESSLDAGVRQDFLQWNIADIDDDPNILSELTWKRIRSFTLATRGSAAYENRFLLDWSGDYGWVYDGQNQDSDYLGNNRTVEFSRSNNNSSIGHVMDISTGAGYRVDLNSVQYARFKEWLLLDDLFLDLLAGFSYSRQKFYMTDGLQTVPADGPFGGLKSHYDAEWKGPWVGFQLKGKKDRILSFLRMEYHWADYYAQANWNLRTDFQHPKSYQHTADGQGVVVAGGAGYLIRPFWSLDLGFKYQYWRADNGVDTTYFSNGAIVSTRLNEVIWRSTMFTLGNTLRF